MVPSDALERPSLDLAPWHAARPHLVVNALLAARSTAPHLAQLAENLLPAAPRRPLASQTIRSDTRDRHSDPALLDDALSLPWMALDGEHHANAIAIDVDHADVEDRLDALAACGLARPAAVVDPWSGRAHVIARLRTPVAFGEGSRVGPQILWALAGRLLAAALGGSHLPRRSLLKSPWGLAENLIGQRLRRSATPAVPGLWDAYLASGSPLMWHTLPGDCRSYELREIVGALADDYGAEIVTPGVRRAVRRQRPEPSHLGRNCMLFDLVRFWAYDRAETDGRAIQEEADRVNVTFAEPLPQSEVRATARSIARFMATRFRPRAVDSSRGRDAAAGTDLDVHGRRQLSATTSAASRSATTDAAIADAFGRLQTSGRSITQATIAAEAGLGLRTIKRRWRVPFDALSGSASRALPQGASSPARSSSSRVPTLGQTATRDRQIRRAVAALAAVAEAARRPGAEPLDLPLIHRDVASIREVRDARRAAETALSDARRRATARAARAEAAGRRDDYEARLAADPAAAWRWWRAQLTDLDITWDALESNADDAHQLAAIRAQRDAVIVGRWRSWRAAVRAVQGARETALAAVPW